MFEPMPERAYERLCPRRRPTGFIPEVSDDVDQRALHIRRQQHFRIRQLARPSLMIAMPPFAQMSSVPASTSGRIGIEPFLALNATCADGEVITVARRFCAFTVAALSLFGIRIRRRRRDTANADRMGKQPEFLYPRSASPLENSPFAQSPMICTPALPK